MTTIVYDHKNKQVACDSRITRGDVICTNEGVKWLSDGQGVWFFCGKTCDKQMLIDYFSGKPQKDNLIPESAAFYFKFDDGVYLRTVNDDGVIQESPIDFSDAIGSGEQWAISALDHGKTAKEAIEYAMSRDVYTGGEVVVFEVMTDGAVYSGEGG